MVSIILPVYNGQRYLQEQIESLLRQTYRNIEVIVVDDNSKDKSLEIARELTTRDARIKVYENKVNMGVVPNFLKALSLAKGEFICFSDQDDYWRDDKIQILKVIIEGDSQNMLAYSDLEICDANLNPVLPSFWKVAGSGAKKGYLREFSFLKNVTPGCSMMFRKEVADTMFSMPQDIPFMHDHFALVVASGLGRIAFSNQKLVKYRQHSGNAIGAFYNSVINEEKISKDLKKKVRYFRENPITGINFNLNKLDEFADSLCSRNLFKRLLFLNYYLFLRNHTFIDKILGVLQCIFPAFYIWLREIKKLPHPLGSRNDVTFYAHIKRILFITWVFIVLYYFLKEFVMHKLVKFLGYMR